MAKWLVPALAGAMLVAATAYGQQAEVYKFRLEPDFKNVGPCIALDTTMRRQHTLTVAGNSAKIVGSGGVDADMAPIAARVYQNNTVQIGANQFRITADMASAPAMLLIADNRLGCRWSGTLSR